MFRYTITVPRQYNDGAPVSEGTFALIEEHIISITGGFTVTDGLGAWHSGGQVYHEPVKVYALDADESDSTERDVRDAAERIGEALRQEAMYVTRQPIQPTLIYPRPATVGGTFR